MTTRVDIKKVLRENYGGEFSTALELQYEDKVLNNVSSKNKTSAMTWLTYNQVILELKNNLKDILKTRELQYRLTDDENPNSACLSVLEDIKSKSPELERLYNKIMNF